MALKQPSHYWPFVRGYHRWPVVSPHKEPVTWYSDNFFLISLNKLLLKQSSCPNAHMAPLQCRNIPECSAAGRQISYWDDCILASTMCQLPEVRGYIPVIWCTGMCFLSVCDMCFTGDNVSIHDPVSHDIAYTTIKTMAEPPPPPPPHTHTHMG